ncbi:MAG: ribonuclease HIII, partial [Candidatus Marinamargulisbacteria bacterium]|nr:ribonuclease HIII [Candidatus Marinamargulisbacteria bacterium]
QLECLFNQSTVIIRLFFGKKGPSIDLSQVKSFEQQKQLHTWLSPLAVTITPRQIGVAAPLNTNLTPSIRECPLPLIGVDESGKGDFFGPLVTAAAYVTPDTAPALQSRGVTDSKRLNDTQIAQLATWIKAHCPHTILSLLPERYNKRYPETSNLNTLLATCHIDVIEHLSHETSCKVALSDQFAKPTLLHQLGRARIPHITIHQATRAESNIAVAAASILARNQFITDLQALSNHIGIVLPKGATHIQTAYAQVLASLGRDQLHTVAKTHFKCAK